MSTVSLEHYLKALRLPTFLKEHSKVGKVCEQENASYEAFLLRLSEQEFLERQGRAVQIRIKKAKFPMLKTLESFDFKSLPGLNKRLVLELSKGDYLETHENVIALGNSGTGKTHTAIALGLSACQQGKSVYFTQAAHLVHMLLEAQEERELLKLKKKLITHFTFLNHSNFAFNSLMRKG